MTAVERRIGPKITVAQCVYDLNRAGAQQVVAHIVRLAARCRFRMIVYAFKNGPLSREIGEAGRLVRIVPQYFPYFDPSLVVRLSNWFRRDGVDIVHTHLFGADLHAGLAAKLFARIPAITTIHQDRNDNWRQRLSVVALLRSFDRIVTVGKSVSDFLAASCPHLVGESRMIPNGVCEPKDLENLRRTSRRTLQVSESALVIGTVGRLSRQKSHLELIEAFETVAREVPRAKLVILGEGPLRPSLEAARSRAGLVERIIMPGNLPRASLLIPGFDLFVLSSRWEGLPMALLEAMVAGVPCISTDVGDVSQVIQDGNTGRLVIPGRSDLLANAILAVFRRSDMGAALGQAAHRLVARDYTASAMVSRYEDLYRDLVSPGLPRHAQRSQT